MNNKLNEYKYSGTFANRKYEELSHPKRPKMCDPILVTPVSYTHLTLPTKRIV